MNRSLQWLQNGTLVFREPKTAKARRQIAMTPSLAIELRRYKAEVQALRLLTGKPLTEEDPVFAHPEGAPINPNTVSPAFRKVARRTGLALGLHSLRHTHATMMLKAGVHPKIVQERLGHSSINVTLDVYSHVAPCLQQAAAQAFDNLLSPEREKQAVQKGG